MTSVDFAAAQQRVADRRQARIIELRARDQARSSERALSASNHLPFHSIAGAVQASKHGTQ